METIIAGIMPTKIHNIVIYALAVIFLMGFNVAPAADGIVFEKISISDAIAKAKTQDKHVFVYVFAKWCGQCKQLKRTSFKDESVGNYYNKNFINIAVDGESAEGSAFCRELNIDSYPTLLVIDGNGNVRTKTKGVMKPYILINFGRRIVP